MNMATVPADGPIASETAAGQPSGMPASLDQVSLDVLAASIVDNHRAFADSTHTATQHSVLCGELLLAAKDRIPHGQWLAWLEGNCQLSIRRAQFHMRAAKCAATAHLPPVDDDPQGFEDLEPSEPATASEDFADAEPNATAATGNVQFVPLDRLVELFSQALPSDQKAFAEWVAAHQQSAGELAAETAEQQKISVDDAIAEADFAAAVDALGQNVGRTVRDQILAGQGPWSKTEVVKLARLKPAAQRKAWRQRNKRET
jgi:hypothetical protein